MAGTSINFNAIASASRSYMNQSAKLQNDAQQRAQTGKNTYNAAKTPSESALVNQQTATISTLTQAVKNASQMTALIDMGASAISNVQNILLRMKSLTAQANNQALDDDKKAMLDQEYQKLLGEINNIQEYTQWGNTKIFKGGAASVAANGAVTQAFTVNAVANAFTNAFTTGATQGSISGIISDATVTANNGLFDVTVTYADGKSFTATTNTPVASDVLILKNQRDGISTLGLTFAAAVTGFDGTAATFQSLLRQHLGVTGAGARSVGTNGSIAMYTGVTSSPSMSAAAGDYTMTYTVANGEGTFTVSNGLSKSSTKITAGAALNQVVTVGDFTLALANFNGSATLGQVGMTVTAGSSITMSAQIDSTSDATIGATFNAMSTTTLQIAGTNIATQGAAAAASALVSAASSALSRQIAVLGGTRSQIEFQADSVQSSIEKQSLARETVEGADIPQAIQESTVEAAKMSIQKSVFANAIQDAQSLSDLVQQTMRR